MTARGVAVKPELAQLTPLAIERTAKPPDLLTQSRDLETFAFVPAALCVGRITALRSSRYAQLTVTASAARDAPFNGRSPSARATMGFEQQSGCAVIFRS